MKKDLINLFMNKTSNHESHLDNCGNHNSGDMVSGKEKPKDLLSEKERELYEILKKTPTGNHWGEAIRKVVRRKSVSKFRQLIVDLKSQTADGPEVMKSIIGEGAMQLLHEL